MAHAHWPCHVLHYRSNWPNRTVEVFSKPPKAPPQEKHNVGLGCCLTLYVEPTTNTWCYILNNYTTWVSEIRHKTWDWLFLPSPPGFHVENLCLSPPTLGFSCDNKAKNTMGTHWVFTYTSRSAQNLFFIEQMLANKRQQGWGHSLSGRVLA
jgi:hypothetical protein